MYKIRSIWMNFSGKCNSKITGQWNCSSRISSNLSNNNNRMTCKSLSKDRIVWMDLEMTGLNIRTDKILEISCLITDGHLNIIATGPELAINYPPEILNNIQDPWVNKQHKSSGLLEKCLKSQINLEMAEQMVLDFLKQHVAKKSCQLAGNSIYMDRFFIAMNMPLIHDYLHYRLIDLSTIKELAKRWNPAVFRSAPNKSGCHRSLADIKESIVELQHYRKHFFKLTEEQQEKEEEDDNDDSSLQNT